MSVGWRDMRAWVKEPPWVKDPRYTVAVLKAVFSFSQKDTVMHILTSSSFIIHNVA